MEESTVTKRHQRDLITHLPESIIGQILSLIPLNEAVRTSVLSHQWRRLWIHTTHLNLAEDFIGQYSCPLRWAAAVDTVLSSITYVFSCELGWPRPFPYNQSADIDRFLRILVQRGIQKLQIQPPFSNLDLYNIPPCLFDCQTLTNLDIRRCDLPIPPHLSLTRLKTLYLQHVSIPHDGDRLIAGLIASCNSLQRLKFDECTGVRHLRLCSPTLKYIRVCTTSPISIFLEDTPCLRSAGFFLGNDEDPEENWNAYDLVKLLIHPVPLAVETLWLDLGLDPIMALYEEHGYLSPFSSFPYLKKLRITIELMHATAFSFFACLLRSCPQLEELRITIEESYEEDPTAEIGSWDGCDFHCLTHSLSAVRIDFDKHYDNNDMEFVRYLLANTPCLKKMYLSFSLNPAPAIDTFLMVKKASPHAEISIMSNV